MVEDLKHEISSNSEGVQVHKRFVKQASQNLSLLMLRFLFRRFLDSDIEHIRYSTSNMSRSVIADLHWTSSLTDSLQEPFVVGEGEISDINLYIFDKKTQSESEVRGVYTDNPVYISDGESLGWREIIERERGLSASSDGVDIVIEEIPQEELSESKGEVTGFVKEISSDIRGLRERGVSPVNEVSLPPEMRKHLVFFTKKSDVYVDKEEISDDDADMLADVLSQKVLPPQYADNGDIYLNPYGAVSLLNFIESLSLDDIFVIASKFQDFKLDYYLAYLLLAYRYWDKSESLSGVSLDLQIYSIAEATLKEAYSLADGISGEVSSRVTKEMLFSEIECVISQGRIGNLTVLFNVITQLVRSQLYADFVYLNQEISRLDLSKLYVYMCEVI